MDLSNVYTLGFWSVQPEQRNRSGCYRIGHFCSTCSTGSWSGSTVESLLKDHLFGPKKCGLSRQVGFGDKFTFTKLYGLLPRMCGLSRQVVPQAWVVFEDRFHCTCSMCSNRHINQWQEHAVETYIVRYMYDMGCLISPNNKITLLQHFTIP